MRTPIAIVIAGALIAAAILVAFRWQISAGAGFVSRIDRWTGHAVTCDGAVCTEWRFKITGPQPLPTWPTPPSR